MDSVGTLDGYTKISSQIAIHNDFDVLLAVMFFVDYVLRDVTTQASFRLTYDEESFY